MSRFEPTVDGWRDTKTGFEWSKTLGKATWNKAAKLVPAGWRLPTIEELVTVVDWTRKYPATELPDTQSFYYWSATTYADYPYSAWYVDFTDGIVTNGTKPNDYYVRAVRGGL